MKRSVKIQAVGCRIEIIGGSVYPKEEGWHFQCGKCGEWHTAKLRWDQDACEFNLTILPDVVEGETAK